MATLKDIKARTRKDSTGTPTSSQPRASREPAVESVIGMRPHSVPVPKQAPVVQQSQGPTPDPRQVPTPQVQSPVQEPVQTVPEPAAPPSVRAPESAPVESVPRMSEPIVGVRPEDSGLLQIPSTPRDGDIDPLTEVLPSRAKPAEQSPLPFPWSSGVTTYTVPEAEQVRPAVESLAKSPSARALQSGVPEQRTVERPTAPTTDPEPITTPRVRAPVPAARSAVESARPEPRPAARPRTQPPVSEAQSAPVQTVSEPAAPTGAMVPVKEPAPAVQQAPPAAAPARTQLPITRSPTGPIKPEPLSPLSDFDTGDIDLALDEVPTSDGTDSDVPVRGSLAPVVRPVSKTATTAVYPAVAEPDEVTETSVASVTSKSVGPIIGEPTIAVDGGDVVDMNETTQSMRSPLDASLLAYLEGLEAVANQAGQAFMDSMKPLIPHDKWEQFKMAVDSFNTWVFSLIAYKTAPINHYVSFVAADPLVENMLKAAKASSSPDYVAIFETVHADVPFVLLPEILKALESRLPSSDLRFTERVNEFKKVVESKIKESGDTDSA